MSKQTLPLPARAEAEATKRHSAAMRVGGGSRSPDDGARMFTAELRVFASIRQADRGVRSIPMRGSPIRSR